MKKNSHGFWAGVVIMILLACMSLKDILKESDWEGRGGGLLDCLICKENKQYTWWTATTLVIKIIRNVHVYTLLYYTCIYFQLTFSMKIDKTWNWSTKEQNNYTFYDLFTHISTSNS